ncbi:MAG: hypothetical protein WD068_00250 [Candidatus Babeliales bacterium]
MKHHRIIGIGILCLCMPGCVNQYSRWAQKTFNQGTPLDQYQQEVAPFLITEHLYDQFNTIGIFDALWLAAPVRRAYAELAIEKTGKSERDYEILVQKELEKNNDLISFYVLIEKEYTIRGLKQIGDADDALWSTYLEIDDTVVHPVSIDKVDLAPEYRTMFGSRVSEYKARLKQAYRISFDAHGVPGQPFIHDDVEKMSLVLSTTEKRVCLTWAWPARLERRRS